MPFARRKLLGCSPSFLFVLLLGLGELADTVSAVASDTAVAAVAVLSQFRNDKLSLYIGA